MKKFTSDILYNIFEYLPNEDIFKLPQVCKYYKKITSQQYFYYKIKYREHPMVFNYADNICKKCNINIIFLFSDKEFNFTRCKHI